MPKTVAQINEEAQRLLNSIDQRNLLEECDQIAALQAHYDKHGKCYETELEDEVFALLNECEAKTEEQDNEECYLERFNQAELNHYYERGRHK